MTIERNKHGNTNPGRHDKQGRKAQESQKKRARRVIPVKLLQETKTWARWRGPRGQKPSVTPNINILQQFFFFQRLNNARKKDQQREAAVFFIFRATVYIDVEAYFACLVTLLVTLINFLEFWTHE